MLCRFCGASCCIPACRRFLLLLAAAVRVYCLPFCRLPGHCVLPPARSVPPACLHRLVLPGLYHVFCIPTCRWMPATAFTLLLCAWVLLTCRCSLGGGFLECRFLGYCVTCRSVPGYLDFHRFRGATILPFTCVSAYGSGGRLPAVLPFTPRFTFCIFCHLFS